MRPSAVKRVSISQIHGDKETKPVPEQFAHRMSRPIDTRSAPPVRGQGLAPAPAGPSYTPMVGSHFVEYKDPESAKPKPKPDEEAKLRISPKPSKEPEKPRKPPGPPPAWRREMTSRERDRIMLRVCAYLWVPKWISCMRILDRWHQRKLGLVLMDRLLLRVQPGFTPSGHQRKDHQRAAAIRAVGHVGEKGNSHLLGAVGKRLREENPALRAAAVDAISHLIAATEDEANKALQRSGALRDALDSVAERLSDEALPVRSAAAKAIGKMMKCKNDPRVLDKILGRLKNEDVGQMKAFESMYALRGDVAQDDLKHLTACANCWAHIAEGQLGVDLLKPFMRDPRDGVRNLMVGVLQQIAPDLHDAVAYVSRFMLDPSQDVRLTAIYAIGKMHCKVEPHHHTVMVNMNMAMEHPDRQTRLLALQHLPTVVEPGDEWAIGIAAMRLEHVDQSFRNAALKTMAAITGKRGNRRVVAEVCKRLHHSDQRVRKSAANAVALMTERGDLFAVDEVLSLLSDYYPTIRLSGVKVLLRLANRGDRRVIRKLNKLARQETEENIRDCAKWVLKKLGDKRHGWDSDSDHDWHSEDLDLDDNAPPPPPLRPKVREVAVLDDRISHQRKVKQHWDPLGGVPVFVKQVVEPEPTESPAEPPEGADAMLLSPELVTAAASNEDYKRRHSSSSESDVLPDNITGFRKHRRFSRLMRQAGERDNKTPQQRRREREQERIAGFNKGVNPISALGFTPEKVETKNSEAVWMEHHQAKQAAKYTMHSTSMRVESIGAGDMPTWGEYGKGRSVGQDKSAVP